MEDHKSENWNFYLANIDLNIASVCLDLDAKNNIITNDYPYLCWLFIQLKIEHDDGLSDDNEFTDLCAYEKIIEKNIICKSIIYVGRITTQGMRQFFFYSSNDIAVFEDIISKVVKEDPSYEYEHGYQKDVKWRQFETVLYPCKEELEQIASRQHQI